MIIPVVWCSFRENVPSRGYWDQGFLMHLFEGNIWKSFNDFQYKEYFSWDEYEVSGHCSSRCGAIVIFPAKAHETTEYVELFNNKIASLNWVIIILGEDECGDFPFKQIKHPNCKLIVMNPFTGRHDCSSLGKIGNGFPYSCRIIGETLKSSYMTKSLLWTFMGQNTHSRRKECIRVLSRLTGGNLVATDGFAKGLPYRDYLESIANSKFVPCPSGVVSPDSFRLFESLELGAIPIADNISPRAGFLPGYWNLLFGNKIPFPIINDWKDLEVIINSLKDDWKSRASVVYAWWQQQKRKFLLDLESDIIRLANLEIDSSTKTINNKITVLICTSPINDHPSTDILYETIASIRQYKELQEVEIILMFDGIRKEQLHYKEKYEDYIRTVLWDCNFTFKNVLPVVFEKHMHQASMTKYVLQEFVKTEFILFVEHDTPLQGEIPWELCVGALSELDLVRFLHETHIHKEHNYLMLDKKPILVKNLPVTRTIQWSQRPHLANSRFYLEILTEYFSQGSCTMIEDRMHGMVQSYPKNFNLAIYNPGGNIKRSYHIDGRGSDPKFEMIF